MGMKYVKAKIYWRDNPDVELERIFGVLGYEDDLEDQERTELDQLVFFYITGGQDEIDSLQSHRESSEDFVILKRSIEDVDVRELQKYLK